MRPPKLVVVETSPRTDDGAGMDIVDPDEAAAITRLNHFAVNVVLLIAGPPLGGHANIADFNRCHAAVHRAYGEAGAQVDALLFCPHAAGQPCDCRLPAPRLLTAACERFCSEKERAVVIARSLPVHEAAGLAALPVVWIGSHESGLQARIDPVDTLSTAVERLLYDVHRDSP